MATQETIYCPYCGGLNWITEDYCYYCGSQLLHAVPPAVRTVEQAHGPRKLSRLVCLVVILVFILLLGSCTFFSEENELQSEMDDVIKSDPRNMGIEVSVHYNRASSTLVYDLRSVSNHNSMLDVFRVFLQFAERMASRKFETVELAYRGRTKFLLDGAYFQKLGREYSWQNPIYTIRTFPENLRNPDGSPAYGHWTGGILGVTAEQLEDFSDFHRKWYLNDIMLGVR